MGGSSNVGKASSLECVYVSHSPSTQQGANKDSCRKYANVVVPLFFWVEMRIWEGVRTKSLDLETQFSSDGELVSATMRPSSPYRNLCSIPGWLLGWIVGVTGHGCLATQGTTSGSYRKIGSLLVCWLAGQLLPAGISWVCVAAGSRRGWALVGWYLMGGT